MSQQTIDDKVRRILRVVLRTAEGGEGALDTPAHRALAREAAAEAIVLLKNDRGVLPLKKGAMKSIAVIGPNAAEVRVGGGGSSVVDPFHAVSPLDGLKDEVRQRHRRPVRAGLPAGIGAVADRLAIPDSRRRRAGGTRPARRVLQHAGPDGQLRS